MQTPRQVPLVNLARSDFQNESERFESFKAGGGGMVKRKEVILSHVEVAMGADGLMVTATHNGSDSSTLKEFTDAPRTTVVEGTSSALDFPQSWKGYDRVVLDVTNGPAPLTISGAGLSGFSRGRRLCVLRANMSM